MTIEFFQIILLVIVVLILAVPLASYMAQIYLGRQFSVLFPLRWLELMIYRALGVDANREMPWKTYASALLWFNAVGFVGLFLLQVFQSRLPLNQNQLPDVSSWLAFNTAVSFVTNTNWQAYSGESTMTHLTQMLGLGVQNFVSAATGMAVAAALARAIVRKSCVSIGNFWSDMTRSVIYILLPLSILLALILVSQGVVQSFAHDLTVTTLGGGTQILPLGPAASQIAIKQLGTNGGGFFGVNSAHPFENPNAVTNFTELLAILLIPTATPIMYGRMVGNKKHGLAILAAMAGLFVVILSFGIWAELSSSARFATMEGKELRFGVTSSVLWTIATTATSNGSVNAMISSMSPLSGGLALLNMMLGEVVFGGVGCGLYGMVMFVILAVFIAGLMVGRTPEYLGKKIEAKEVTFAVIAVIGPCVLILLGSALALSMEAPRSSILNQGPHGLTEILYAFSSAAGNNGSAFAGLNANTPFFNFWLGTSMIFGRYLVILPVLALAGSLASKKLTPPSPGTFPVEGGMFTGLLVGVVVIIGALTFFPVLSLGPIVEHLLLARGYTF